MLDKIRDIHELELELDKIEENSSITQSKPIETIELNKSKKILNRNDEVMNEIKFILKDLVNADESIIETSQHELIQTISHVSHVYEEYGKIKTERIDKKE
jgi:hypothetical protein